MRMTAAGTAATASGQPRGLITAQASTASRASTEIVSPTAAFSAVPPRETTIRISLAYPYQATGIRRDRPHVTASRTPPES